MASSIPRITTTRHEGGWLNSCPGCQMTSWHTDRPAADRAAREHLARHGSRGVRV